MSAARAASNSPNGIAAAAGRSCSCSSISDEVRGPRSHSYRTTLLSRKCSPSAMALLKSGSAERLLDQAAIRRLVSSKIITQRDGADPHDDALGEVLQVLCRLPLEFEWAAWTSS